MVSIVVFRGEPEKNIHFEIRVRLTPSTLGLKILMKTLFSAIFGKLLHFIIDGREPKLFDFKSSSQQQCCKAHKIGQLYHQDQASTFQLALKWQKGANGGFCKFGPFQPYLTHRQLDWSSMMFIESHFYGYLTYLVFAHVVWWLRAL